MSRDQWHPQPAVRALVRLWTKLFAGRCGWSLDPQDNVPRKGIIRGHLRLSSPSLICPLLSPAISQPVRPHVFCLPRLSESSSPLSVIFWILLILSPLGGGRKFQTFEGGVILKQLKKKKKKKKNAAQMIMNTVFFYDYRKEKAITKQCLGNRTAASLPCSCRVFTSLRWPANWSLPAHPLLSTNKQAGQWQL